MERLSLVALLIMAALAFSRPLAAQPTVIEIDTEVADQTFHGWGVTLPSMSQFPGVDRYSDELVLRAVTQFGITRLRLEIGPENEPVNDNDDPFVAEPAGFNFSGLDETVSRLLLPMRTLIERRGDTMRLELGFAPALGGSTLHFDAEEYAELLEQAVLHLRDSFQLEVSSIDLLLAPDRTISWHGGEIGRAVVALWRRLSGHGLRPLLIAPSTANPSNAPRFYDELARVDSAVMRLGGISYQRRFPAVDTALRSIRTRATRGYHLVGLSDMGFLGNVGSEELLRDLTLASASWWHFGRIVQIDPAEGGGLFTVDTSRPAGRMLTPTRAAARVAPLLRSLRTGMRRIGALSSDTLHLPVAFRLNDSVWIYAVRARDTGAIVLQGLRFGSYAVSLVGDDGAVARIDTLRLGVPSKHDTFKIDRRGLLTVVPLGGLGVIDVVPPTVMMTTPNDGSDVYYGMLWLEANASDDIGVASVEFVLYSMDEEPLGSLGVDSTLPYGVMLDSRSQPSGRFRLGAVATDFAGNVARSATVWISMNEFLGTDVPPGRAPSERLNIAPLARIGDHHEFFVTAPTVFEGLLQIFDLQGVQVGGCARKVIEPGERLVLNVADVPAGSYFLRLTDASSGESCSSRFTLVR